MEITAHKGGNQGEEGAIRWLTTDRQHAAGFGSVSTYRIQVDDRRVSRFDADDIDLPEGGGWEVEEAMKEAVEEDGCWLAILEGWEGRGVCLWIAEPDTVLREGEEARSYRSYIRIEEVE